MFIADVTNVGLLMDPDLTRCAIPLHFNPQVHEYQAHVTDPEVLTDLTLYLVSEQVVVASPEPIIDMPSDDASNWSIYM